MKMPKFLVFSLIVVGVFFGISSIYLSYLALNDQTVGDSLPELDSIYISPQEDILALEIDQEDNTIPNTEEINPSKTGTITTDDTRKIVTFEKDLSQEEINNLEETYDIQFTDDTPINGTYSIITTQTSDTDSLKNDDLVEDLETDIPVKMYADTMDWGVVRVGANQVWETGSGSGIVVAVIDTGIELTHSDLSSNIVSGYDFVNNDSSANDDNGHGTHVSGIVASTMNGAGNVGASYSAKLMPVKVLNESGYGYLSDIAKGIYFATDNGARIINMSLGTTTDSDTLRRAVQYATNKGVLMVAAAGNSSGAPCGYPAAYSSVICVVAIDSNNKLASFSNIGGELAAPGVSNYSTYKNNSYAKLSGTSMASPHVAGSAALLMSICTDCSTSEIRELLRSTATDLGSVDYDIIFGYGLVNLVEAVKTLTPQEEITPIEDPADDSEETPSTDTEFKEENSGDDSNIKNQHKAAPIEYVLNITSPQTNSSKRYILQNPQDIDVEFEINPSSTEVKYYEILLNNEKVEDYDGQSTKFTFEIDSLQSIQYQLYIKAVLTDNTEVSDSILLDLTHLTRGRSVRGISDVRNWFERLFFN
jgi:subtilisin family serine protease